MVRKVSYGRLVLGLWLASTCLFPSVARAEDVGSYSGIDYTSQLDSIGYKLDNISSGIAGSAGGVDYGPRLDSMAQTLNNIYTVQMQQEQPEEEQLDQKPEEVKQEGPTELDYLKSIDEGIAKMNEVEPETETEVKSLGESKAATSLVAYTNVQPTGQWATYAKGYLPRVGWKEHYVFLQDTTSSYVMAWGDLSDDGQKISGNAEWVRWYYVGNGYGYRKETGSGQLSVDYGGYTVMSDLENWPTLAEPSEQLRRELMLYAVVAAALFSLSSVTSFLLRNRNGTH